MLVLSRKIGESVVIGDGIVVSVLDVRGDSIRIGIKAPRDVPVNRSEVVEAVIAANKASIDSSDWVPDLTPAAA